MQPTPPQIRKGLTTALFVAIALVTIGIAILSLRVLTLPLPGLEGQTIKAPTAAEIQAAVSRTRVILLITALGLADAMIWWRGLRWGGYLMLVYAVLHFAGLLVLGFFLLLSALGTLPVPFLIILFLLLIIPIFLDGIVLRSVARDLAKRWAKPEAGKRDTDFADKHG